MAIGIRRDREGVMPGTLSFPAAAATGLEKGDIVKLSGGLLVKGVAGDVFDKNARYMVVANYVADLTAPSATNYDCVVVPLDDELTYVGTVTEAGTGNAATLVAGSKIDLNATGDGFVIDDSPAPTDFIIVKILETVSSDEIIVEAAVA